MCPRALFCPWFAGVEVLIVAVLVAHACLQVRFRVPPAHAGKMVSVTVGGQAWQGFDAASETVDFTAADLGSAQLRQTGLAAIVATFAPAAVESV